MFVCLSFMPFPLWQPGVHLKCVLHNCHRRESFHLWNTSGGNKGREETEAEWKDGSLSKGREDRDKMWERKQHRMRGDYRRGWVSAINTPDCVRRPKKQLAVGLLCIPALPLLCWEEEERSLPSP